MPEPHKPPAPPQLPLAWLWIVLCLSIVAAVANALGGLFRIAFTAAMIALVIVLAVWRVPALHGAVRPLVRGGAAGMRWGWRQRWRFASVLLVVSTFFLGRRAVLMHGVERHAADLMERGWLLSSEALSAAPLRSPEDDQFTRAFEALCNEPEARAMISRYKEMRLSLGSLEVGLSGDGSDEAAEKWLASSRPLLEGIAALLARFPHAALFEEETSGRLQAVLVLLRIDALDAARRGDPDRAARASATGLRLFLARGRAAPHMPTSFLQWLPVFVGTLQQVVAHADLRDEDLGEVQRLFEALAATPVEGFEERRRGSRAWKRLRETRYGDGVELTWALRSERFWWWLWYQPVQQQRFLDAWRLRCELLSALAAKQQQQTSVLKTRYDQAVAAQKRCHWPEHFMNDVIQFMPTPALERILVEDYYPRIAATAVAVERFRAAHRCWPETLDLLVPQFLASVPPDPLLPQPLTYWPSDHGFSVGADQRRIFGHPGGGMLGWMFLSEDCSWSSAAKLWSVPPDGSREMHVPDGGVWFMAGQPVTVEGGWTITFPPGVVHTLISRGLFGRVQRRDLVLRADDELFVLAVERLPNGYAEQRGTEQILLDAFDAYRAADVQLDACTWHGYPAMRSATGIAVLADGHRYSAFVLNAGTDPELKTSFLDSLQPVR